MKNEFRAPRAPRKTNSIADAVTREAFYSSTGEYWSIGGLRNQPHIDAHFANRHQTSDDREYINTSLNLKINGSHIAAARRQISRDLLDDLLAVQP